MIRMMYSDNVIPEYNNMIIILETVPAETKNKIKQDQAGKRIMGRTQYPLPKKFILGVPIFKIKNEKARHRNRRRQQQKPVKKKLHAN
jgi:hypothetical protein